MKAKKLLVLCLAVTALITSLTGCGSADEISELNNMSALNSESSVTENYNMSYTDEQEAIYAQVSNRQLLDLSALTKCTDNEIQQVVNYMNQVDDQLTGKLYVTNYADSTSKFVGENLLTDEAVLDSYLTDYLLAFMQQTPYYWQRSKMSIRGMDAKSRSVVVDVTYKTIDFEKEVRIDSTIVKGDPDFDRLSESRFNKWINILSLRENNSSSPELPTLESNFYKYWGDPDVIIAEQSKGEPTTRIYYSGNQETYSGLINSEAEQTNGELTVRYILVPKYVLGLNLGITCEHMYITNYSIDDCTKDLTIFAEEGYQTITDSVYSLIYSYFTCMDESDYNGLYKLTSNFEGLDKHYQDRFNSTYQKHDGFSVSLFDIRGTHITCGVTISTKERAKNSNMTYPVYTDRYYVELELVDDVLKVSNLVLLSRNLEGEPAINEDEIDTTGFSAEISLDNDDKLAIESLICNFSVLQLKKDTTSDDFSNNVDTSITTNQLTSLKEAMMSLSGERKVVFLVNYQQGTSNYASVKCKELYQSSTNSIVEAQATYEFILKGGKWYVYNYTVNSSIMLDTTNLSTAGSLCLVSPNGTEAYTSQLKGTVSTNLDEVSDISVSYDYKEYTPILKEGVVEQGLVLYTKEDVTSEMILRGCKIAGIVAEDIEQFDGYFDNLATAVEGTEYEGLDAELRDSVLDIVAIYYNKAEGRYSDSLTEENVVNGKMDTINATLDSLSTVLDSIPAEDADNRRYVTEVSRIFNNIQLILN